MSLYNERNNIIFGLFLILFASSVIYALQKWRSGNIQAARTLGGFAIIISALFVTLAVADRGSGLLQRGFIPLFVICVLILSIVRVYCSAGKDMKKAELPRQYRREQVVSVNFCK